MCVLSGRYCIRITETMVDHKLGISSNSYASIWIVFVPLSLKGIFEAPTTLHK